MNIRSLKINRRTSPVGIAAEPLRFSFLADAEAEFSCEVLAPDGTVAAKRQVTLNEAHAFSFPDLKAAPATRYRFCVSAEGAVAETTFETAIAFSAPLITPIRELESPALHRSFFVPADARDLRLAITGLGLYRAELNGTRVGDRYLTPGYNDYDAYLRFDTYDVTNLIRKGETNTLTVYLGNGWYRGRFGIDKPADAGDCVYGSAYLAALELYEPDGGRSFLQSDRNFTATASPSTENSIYDGEIRDYLRPAGEEISCRVAEEHPYRIVPFFGAPIRETTILRPTYLLSPRGEQILDFGQNMVGFVRFSALLPKGTRIRIRHGELLQDGCFYRDNLRTARAEAVYVSDGTQRTYEPYFTYFGFRYALVEGMETVRAEDFLGVVISSDLAETCQCHTSSGDLNRLMENVRWGQRGNFLDVPTDCPQRDERLGWTADAQVFAPTACYLSDCFPFYRKYLADLRYEQTTYYHGDFPMYCPSLRREAGSGGAVWADCGTILPHLLYTFYGDREQLHNDYPMMREYAEVLLARDLAEGNRGLITRHFTFGDWLAQDGVCEQSLEGGTDPGFISSIYYFHSLRLTAESAGILGLQSDRETYTAAAERVRKAILGAFFTDTGRLAVDTQTAYAMALHCGVYRSREAVIAGLKERLRKDFYRIRTGFTGTPLLLPALFSAGMDEDAYRILFSRDFPGWLYAVRMGATTVWERWNSVLPNGKISGTNMNSLNHYAYGSVCEAVFSCIAGLQPTAPGWKSARIECHPDFRLREISLSYDSPSGTYAVAWELLQNGTLRVEVTIPAGCRARLCLPGGGEEELKSGRYLRTVRTPERILHPFSLDTPNLDILQNPAARERFRHFLPQAYAIVTGENPEFLIRNGRFLLSLPMFGASEKAGERYETALRELTGTEEPTGE